MLKNNIMKDHKIDKRNVEDVLPLTFMQEGMFFHYLSNPGSQQYFEQFRYKLKGRIDIKRFKQAWQTVGQTNEMLRAVIRWEKLEEPVQVVMKDREIPVRIRYYNDKQDESPMKSLDDIIADDLGEGIDLAELPLRITLCLPGNGDCNVKIIDEGNMLVTFHHILFDGWSNGIVLTEFLMAYNCITGQPLKKIQKTKYKEFIFWCRSQNKEKQEDFWKRYLEGFDTRTVLPYDTSKTSEIDVMGNCSPILPPALKERLDENGKQYHLTLANFIYTAWGILLQKYNCSDDVIFGTAVSGRQPVVKGIENMVGLFINTLPMRFKAMKDDVIPEVLNHIGRHLEERKEYEHSSLSQIKQLVGIELFDSLIVIDNYPLDVRLMRQGSEPGTFSAGPHLAITDYQVHEMNNFDLTLQVTLPDEGQMKIDFYYNSDVFEFATITRLAGHYLNILEELCVDLQRKLSQVEMLSSAEKEQVLEEFNRTTVKDGIDIERTIHGIIADQALRYPENWAVEYGGQRLTYRQLNEKAGQLAQLLASYGVSEGSRVILMSPRSIDMIITLLGIFKVGAVCIPLDISYPPERGRYIIQDSDAQLVLCTFAARECERNCGNSKMASETLFIEELLNSPERQSQEFTTLLEPPGPAGLAYIIYTSGSTGTPKGMLLPHRGIINHAYTKIDVLEITETDNVAHNFTINFIASIWQILAPLFVGAKVTVYSELIEKDPYVQFSRASADCITIIEVVPSIMKSYLYLLEEGKEAINLNLLKKIALTGEEVKSSLVNRFYSRYRIPLVNCYGQTECSDDVLHYKIPVDINTLKVPIGYPAFNTRVLILNHHEQPQPVGVMGEICVAGVGVGCGYVNRLEMTSEKFYKSYASYRTNILYRTGDLGKWMPDGRVEYLGRIDHQVKIRGNRVELREIDNHLLRCPAIKEAAVIVKENEEGEKNLYAFFMSDEAITAAELRQHLLKTLPDYMIPAHFVHLEKLPLTPSGKIDRKALDKLEIKNMTAVGTEYRPPRSEIEKKILAIWQQLLEKENIGINDNFFDLGGHSLLLIKLKSKLEKTFRRDIAIAELFNYPTVGLQALYFEDNNWENENKQTDFLQKTATEGRPGPTVKVDTAIIGISLRVPGARDIGEFWENLKNGVESISFFTADELESSEMNRFIRGDCRLVAAGGILGNIDLFDADFFGYTPREAEVMDPQQRLFLESAWLALEDAGYVGDTYPGHIGVYAGVGFNSYLLNNVMANAGVVNALGEFQAALGNDKDFLATRIAYKFNLRGPAITVQCACSTSLVAVHLARQALHNGDCDMALVGGAAVRVPEKSGYFFTEQGHLSPDGHCRPFDVNANGTVFGNGAGVVVLKSLPGAIKDKDHIHAVIKGSAINNDGSLKVGYTSPSGVAQAEVVWKAFNDAGVDPDTIGYLETHGTGTVMGDPIEIAALTRAFRTGTVNHKKQYCAIGAVKANIGHLDVAAGIVGLIKAVLCLEHRQIPPIINFQSPNSSIDFENSPFYVNRLFSQWPAPVGETPRRAAVNALGIGGTNAHVILEEYKDASGAQEPSIREGFYYLIPLSAKTQSALDQMTENLAEYLQKNPGFNIDDIAYTLQVGRKEFPYRRVQVVESKNELIQMLTSININKTLSFPAGEADYPVIFMFPGQGAQYVEMGLQLYHNEPVFRDQMNHCFEILQPIIGYDLKTILYPSLEIKKNNRSYRSNRTNILNNLDQTEVAQPLLFIIEYSLAELLIKWGIKPYAMIGHSIGEYTAACLSGVLSLKDALTLVAWRGKLMQQMPPGAMLSVSLSEKELIPLLDKEISLAAINSPTLSVVSGNKEDITSFEKKMEILGHECRRLHTSHAFHSHMMDPVLKEFAGKVKTITLNHPRIPYISNVTGDWILKEDVVSTGYWTRQLRETVRFNAGIKKLLELESAIYIEVGPGNTLSAFARSCLDKKEERAIFNLLRHPQKKVSDVYYFLDVIGHLWLYGYKINWQAIHEFASPERRRVSLPTYPFEKKHCWLKPFNIESQDSIFASQATGINMKKASIDSWFYIPSWKQTILPLSVGKGETAGGLTLIFFDNGGFGLELTWQWKEQWKDKGHDTVMVKTGESFSQEAPGVYTVNPTQPSDYQFLLKDIRDSNRIITKIIHSWMLTSNCLNKGVYSLLYLVKALVSLSMFQSMDLWVVSGSMHKIDSRDIGSPEKATILGSCKVISQEYPNITCRSLDIGDSDQHDLIQLVMAELNSSPQERVIAYRGSYRWVQLYEAVKVEKAQGVPAILRQKGVYLITGGLGKIGLTLARYLARVAHARLALISRTWPLAKEDPRMTELRRLEEMGARVLVVRVDVSEREQMQEALRQVEEKFGAVQGVIHAAGTVAREAFKPIAGLEKQDCDIHFKAKMHGLYVLQELFQDKKPDFFIMMSSLSSILGGLTMYAYSAANSFMDLFAQSSGRRLAEKCISIDWPEWEAADAGSQKVVNPLHISMEEAEETFERILNLNMIPQIVVSSVDLLGRLRQWVLTQSHPSKCQVDKTYAPGGNQGKRPQNTFEAPQSEAEKIVTEIWQELLGVESIGVHDDFFQLGGHSLIATKLVSRLRQIFRIDIPLHVLFERPTIKGVVENIVLNWGDPGIVEEIATVYREVEKI